MRNEMNPVLTEGNHSRKKVVIIGAGASGLTAAISAARRGHRVFVIEHMPKGAAKLLLTGNGKCNFTNTDVGFEHYHRAWSFPSDDLSFRKFLETVLGQFGLEECLSFFEEIGVTSCIKHYPYDQTGYVYPSDLKASSVRSALLQENAALGVDIMTDTSLCSLQENETGGFTAGIRQASLSGTETELSLHADRIILAAGSNAYPATGSDNSVYPFLRNLQIAFEPFLPALCALYSKDPLLKELKGQREKGNVRLCSNDIFLVEETGEIQFNEHSLSGIPVMQCSRTASLELKKGRTVSLYVKTDHLSHLFPVHRTAGFDRSQCCTGGIRLEEVDPATMHLFRNPGISLCGEMLDVDGDCGGYNLHFAWASGFIAGNHI